MAETIDIARLVRWAREYSQGHAHR
jgi:hypothetical protein